MASPARKTNPAPAQGILFEDELLQLGAHLRKKKTAAAKINKEIKEIREKMLATLQKAKVEKHEIKLPEGDVFKLSIKDRLYIRKTHSKDEGMDRDREA